MAFYLSFLLDFARETKNFVPHGEFVIGKSRLARIARSLNIFPMYQKYIFFSAISKFYFCLHIVVKFINKRVLLITLIYYIILNFYKEHFFILLLLFRTTRKKITSLFEVSWRFDPWFSSMTMPTNFITTVFVTRRAYKWARKRRPF